MLLSQVNALTEFTGVEHTFIEGEKTENAFRWLKSTTQFQGRVPSQYIYFKSRIPLGSSKLTTIITLLLKLDSQLRMLHEKPLHDQSYIPFIILL